MEHVILGDESAINSFENGASIVQSSSATTFAAAHETTDSGIFGQFCKDTIILLFVGHLTAIVTTVAIHLVFVPLALSSKLLMIVLWGLWIVWNLLFSLMQWSELILYRHENAFITFRTATEIYWNTSGNTVGICVLVHSLIHGLLIFLCGSKLCSEHGILVMGFLQLVLIFGSVLSVFVMIQQSVCIYVHQLTDGQLEIQSEIDIALCEDRAVVNTTTDKQRAQRRFFAFALPSATIWMFLTLMRLAHGNHFLSLPVEVSYILILLKLPILLITQEFILSWPCILPQHHFSSYLYCSFIVSFYWKFFYYKNIQPTTRLGEIAFSIIKCHSLEFVMRLISLAETRRQFSNLRRKENRRCLVAVPENSRGSSLRSQSSAFMLLPSITHTTFHTSESRSDHFIFDREAAPPPQQFLHEVSIQTSTMTVRAFLSLWQGEAIGQILGSNICILWLLLQRELVVPSKVLKAHGAYLAFQLIFEGASVSVAHALRIPISAENLRIFPVQAWRNIFVFSLCLFSTFSALLFLQQLNPL